MEELKQRYKELEKEHKQLQFDYCQLVKHCCVLQQLLQKSTGQSKHNQKISPINPRAQFLRG